MHAVVFKPTHVFGKMVMKDRFVFEDMYLNTLVPPRPCKESLEPEPSPQDIRVFLEPVSQDFEARPYLEFSKQVLNETHFQVMQEGQPTGYTVVLS